jgi:hypothetical protein
MNEIYINRREVEKILAVMKELDPEGTVIGNSKLTSDGESGIGSTLTLTVPLKVGSQNGEYTVVISDESDW